MKKNKFFVISAVILIVGLLTVGFSINAFATVKDGVICEGVFIDTVDVSGMTANEAKKAVGSYVDSLKKKIVTIKVGKNEETITLEELGYNVKENDYIEQAFNVGRSGNVIKRYKEIQDTKNDNLVFTLDFTFDDTKVQTFVKETLSQYNKKSKNATITRKNGGFVVTNHKVGRKVAVNETKEKIINSILNDWNQEDIKLDAVVNDAEPKYTKELLERCNTLLGTYTTNYATSSPSRAANLANGAKLINGTVLYPGEVFSAYEHLNPFTIDNGYETAGAYSQGKVIDSIGGGVCQVSSTLFNAILYSELEVVERSPHSMSVSYVPLSRDAAIAGTYKDFKFKNNTEVPIYIEAYTQGRSIIFNVYGEETRDPGREVEYETKVLDEIAPPEDEITEDKTKPTSFKEVTQDAHIGYKAELYKIVKQDGKEISRELINSSSYAAAPKYVTVGTKEDKKDEEKETKKDKEVDSKETDESKEDTKKDTESSKTSDASSKEKSSTTKESDTTDKTDTADKTETAKDTDTSTDTDKQTNTDSDTVTDDAKDVSTNN
jgi:vancomycin resistance protein YoaR